MASLQCTIDDEFIADLNDIAQLLAHDGFDINEATKSEEVQDASTNSSAAVQFESLVPWGVITSSSVANQFASAVRRSSAASSTGIQTAGIQTTGATSYTSINKNMLIFSGIVNHSSSGIVNHSS